MAFYDWNHDDKKDGQYFVRVMEYKRKSESIQVNYY